jgi:hypothetical protein
MQTLKIIQQNQDHDKLEGVHKIAQNPKEN